MDGAAASSPRGGSSLHLREVSQQAARIGQRAACMQLELGREQRAYIYMVTGSLARGGRLYVMWLRGLQHVLQARVHCMRLQALPSACQVCQVCARCHVVAGRERRA